MVDSGKEEDRLEAGRQAADRHAWSEAFELLRAQDASTELAPEDLDRLAEAAWWTGRNDEGIEVRERAYAAYMERGDRLAAAHVALLLAEDNFHKMAASVGSGWLKQAERLLEGHGDSLEYGFLLRTQTVIAFEGEGDLDGALELAGRTYEIGERRGSRDLTCLALHDRGRILVAAGRTTEGMALMDEVMVAAMGGELDPMTTGRVYCNMISICEKLADYRRAGDWTEAARRWCERAGHLSGFPGLCRVHRAEIMRLRGSWAEAEQEARVASTELRGFVDFAGEAFYEIGEIRLRMGDLVGAESAFRQAHEGGRDPQPGLAMVRLAEGQTETARRLIEGVLAGDPRPPLDRARLLPARVEIALASADVETAESAAVELEQIAADYGTVALEAAAAQARGAVQLVKDSPTEAAESLRRAWNSWRRVKLPFEAAQARLLLGLAHRAGGNEEAAELEIRAAQAAFEELGAVGESTRAMGFLEGREPWRHVREPGKRSASTLMFTDVVGSTQLIEAIGDEAWEHLVRWHDESLRALFAAHGGREVDHAGDGFFVAFEEARPALECAVAIQRTLAEHRRAHGFAPQVRIGLHNAPVGSGYRGKGVHEAARIAALAGGGEILASRGTLEGVPGLTDTSDPRPVKLKGISEPVEVVSITWR